MATSVENRKFPVYFAPPWNSVSVRSQKKLEWCATGPRKKFDDIFSRLDTMHQRDRRTPGDSKDRAYA